MKAEAHEDTAAMRALHEAASGRVDAAPDPSVRAAVLAAAARAVDARPHALEAGPAAAPFGRRRWPVSMAALLVVSLMTGLVVNQAMRDEPDRVTSASAPPSPTPPVSAPTAASALAPAPAPSPATTSDSGTTAEAAPRRIAPGSRSTGVAKPERAQADREPAPDRFVPDAASAPASDAAAAAAKIVAPPRIEPAAPPPPPVALPLPAPVPSGKAASEALQRSSADEAPTVARPAPAINAAQRIRRGPEPLTPEAWVERIVKLREAGDSAAADREVEALRARYPDFDIPAAAFGAAGTR